jgi:hypothetical protein
VGDFQNAPLNFSKRNILENGKNRFLIFFAFRTTIWMSKFVQNLPFRRSKLTYVLKGTFIQLNKKTLNAECKNFRFDVFEVTQLRRSKRKKFRNYFFRFLKSCV